MSARIFVGNLSYDTTEGDLQSLFSEIGVVKEVFLPSDRATGRPRGFAIVEFEDDALAVKAIEELDETDLKGRQIRLSEARDRAPRTSFSPRPGGGGGGRDGGGGDGPPRGGGRPPAKPKGSRRRVRGKKRSL